jgi:phosphotransferase system enzyme I (PtsI)
MIGSAKEALDFADLARNSGNFKVGVMVEQLSLISDIGKLSGTIDFLSVGTNDLAQSLFNLDRQNSINPDLLDPWHPEFLLALSHIADSAKQAEISVSVCGEVAANPAFALVLAQLGFGSVSVAPREVEAVSAALRS